MISSMRTAKPFAFIRSPMTNFFNVLLPARQRLLDKLTEAATLEPANETVERRLENILLDVKAQLDMRPALWNDAVLDAVLKVIEKAPNAKARMASTAILTGGQAIELLGQAAYAKMWPPVRKIMTDVSADTNQRGAAIRFSGQLRDAVSRQKHLKNAHLAMIINDDLTSLISPLSRWDKKPAVRIAAIKAMSPKQNGVLRNVLDGDKDFTVLAAALEQLVIQNNGGDRQAFEILNAILQDKWPQNSPLLRMKAANCLTYLQGDLEGPAVKALKDAYSTLPPKGSAELQTLSAQQLASTLAFALQIFEDRQKSRLDGTLKPLRAPL